MLFEAVRLSEALAPDEGQHKRRGARRPAHVS
jgi:hypothetical protein